MHASLEELQADRRDHRREREGVDHVPYLQSTDLAEQFIRLESREPPVAHVTARPQSSRGTDASARSVPLSDPGMGDRSRRESRSPRTRPTPAAHRRRSTMLRNHEGPRSRQCPPVDQGRFEGGKRRTNRYQRTPMRQSVSRRPSRRSSSRPPCRRAAATAAKAGP